MRRAPSPTARLMLSDVGIPRRPTPHGLVWRKDRRQGERRPVKVRLHGHGPWGKACSDRRGAEQRVYGEPLLSVVEHRGREASKNVKDDEAATARQRGCSAGNRPTKNLNIPRLCADTYLQTRGFPVFQAVSDIIPHPPYPRSIHARVHVRPALRGSGHPSTSAKPSAHEP